MATLSPLPKRIDWEPRELDALVARADRVLTPPRFEIDAEIGFFGRLRLVPSALRARNNPEDRRLAEMRLVRDRRNAQLDLSFAESNAPEQIKQARLREEREKIDSTFSDWMTWVEESMTVEDKPYLQVLAVFARKER